MLDNCVILAVFTLFGTGFACAVQLSVFNSCRGKELRQSGHGLAGGESPRGMVCQLPSLLGTFLFYHLGQLSGALSHVVRFCLVAVRFLGSVPGVEVCAVARSLVDPSCVAAWRCRTCRGGGELLGPCWRAD